MDTRLLSVPRRQFLGEWVETVRSAARRHGISDSAEPVRGWFSGAMLVACVRRLGGTVRPDEPFYGWIRRDVDDAEYLAIDEAAPELAVGEARIGRAPGPPEREVGLMVMGLSTGPASRDIEETRGARPSSRTSTSPR